MSEIKISLCMIVGNVEEYIERCIKSFSAIGDEIVMVRAIGKNKPDKTISIAEKWCKENGKPLIVGEYLNYHKDWPHIDSFASARQKSFDLAHGEYCFWCDSDDILESGAEIVRQHAERGGYAAFVFPYRIFGKGIMVPRERMLLRGSGKWLFPVHECFDFHIKPPQAIEDNRVVVTHLPDLKKQESNGRNLRILRSIPEKEMTCGLWYHLHQELGLAKDVAGSVNAAKKALGSKDIGRPEKYEIYINLAQHTASEPEQKTPLLHAAYAADPTRREALLLLANDALNSNQVEDGLAYARQMRATPLPSFTPWNSREAVYGWVGEDIFAQALRANNRMEEAESVRIESMRKAGGPKISLIHATRGRYEQAAMARKIWLDMADRPDQIEHVFVFDQDDKASAPLSRMHHLCIPTGGGCVAAWNKGAFKTDAPVIVQLSDDWLPMPQWDKLILERIGDVTKPKVLAVSDGVRTDPLLCMAICTKAYWAIDYFLFHPEFTGVFSDNWFTELAYKRGMVTEARDLKFSHEHPIKTGKKLDATYTAQNAPEQYAKGQAILTRLQSGNDWSFVPGFYNFWEFYEFVAGALKDGDTVAEIGVWFGRSIIHLAQMLKAQGKRVKLYAVDSFTGELDQPAHVTAVAAAGGSIRGAFEANVKRCGVGDMIEVLEGDSAEMAGRVADNSLAFCFVDAAHDYDSVKRDLASWEPKLKPDGWLAGHDAQHEPVMRAVRERHPNALTLGPVWVRSNPKVGKT